MNFDATLGKLIIVQSAARVDSRLIDLLLKIIWISRGHHTAAH
jgi:hypothetical protein